jgi:hypothetical protein
LKKHCFFQPQANETFFLQARKGTVKRLVGIVQGKKLRPRSGGEANKRSLLRVNEHFEQFFKLKRQKA